ncbi:flavin dependent monooxygenase [Lasallia pustulata]|uniref:Flavin dependent monooxygenase n=1 Tax=Lasallia pustulata TaxID=136370 RepID=A0A1W5D6G1_9LECA|nr:flavin dependent monooxygenase [Lasallia pustulata]
MFTVLSAFMDGLRRVTSQPERYHVKRIAIIGAGPSGLAAAKYLLAEEAFDKIDVFDQRSNVGGVWNYTAEADDQLGQVSRTDPHQPVERPLWRDVEGEKQPVFVSPMYNRLETNIPHSLMRFSDLEFPQDTQVFPPREVVLRYLETYAESVRHLIQFSTQVVDVHLQMDGRHPRWLVRTQDIFTNVAQEATYDAVVIASGHYNVPYIPDIPGAQAWDRAYPGAMTHSKSYRSPDHFKDKVAVSAWYTLVVSSDTCLQKVIVVGNSASGVDIGNQIAEVCKRPLLQSQRQESYLDIGQSSQKFVVPEIIQFMEADRAVRFSNGRVEKNVDAVLFCTGYLYSYPFLLRVPKFVWDGQRTQHLYQQIFHITHPTLAFLALPQKIIPFPLAECQAAVVARVWSNRLSLPTEKDMAQWEDSVVKERGTGARFHNLTFPLDAEYINELHCWSLRGQPKIKGKTPPCWGEKERWMRERLPAIKKAFADRGADKYQVRSIEELGFDFEMWKVQMCPRRIERDLFCGAQEDVQRFTLEELLYMDIRLKLF